MLLRWAGLWPPDKFWIKKHPLAAPPGGVSVSCSLQVRRLGVLVRAWLRGMFSRPRLGRRGSVLLVLGLIDVSIGWSLLTLPPEFRLGAAAEWRDHYAPNWLWVSLFFGTALVLFVQMFQKRDMVAYSVAIAVKVLYGLNVLASWAFGGVVRGWLGGLVWLAFAGMIFVVAGWAEPIEWNRRARQ